MKKLLVAVVTMLTFAACSNVDSHINILNKYIEEGNLEIADRVLSNIPINSLDEDSQAKLSVVVAKMDSIKKSIAIQDSIKYWEDLEEFRRNERILREKQRVSDSLDVVRDCENWIGVEFHLHQHHHPKNIIDELQSNLDLIDKTVEMSEKCGGAFRSKAARLKKSLSKQMSKYRKTWTKRTNNYIWGNDMKATSYGKTITFIGGNFVLNSNIEDWHNASKDTLRMLGFTKVKYKWYDGDTEYTYYNL